jgi:hypothetical protein
MVGTFKKNLKNKAHLEKNYCWLGWADSPRDADYLCRQINQCHIQQINRFNSVIIGQWQD